MNCEMQSFSDTLWVWPCPDLPLCLEAGLQNPVLGLPCLIVKVLATQTQCLEPTAPFTFHITKCFSFLLWHYDLILICKVLISELVCVALKSYMEWSNAEHVSTLTTIILPTTVSTFYSLNCFSHVIYALQTSMYKNIAKLLTLSWSWSLGNWNWQTEL